LVGSEPTSAHRHRRKVKVKIKVKVKVKVKVLISQLLKSKVAKKAESYRVTA
jgi:hypothetical protein